MTHVMKRSTDGSAGTVSAYSPQGVCVCVFGSRGGHESKHSLSYMARGALHRNVALSVLCSQEVTHKTMNE